MKDRQSEDMHVGLLNEEARWSCRIYTHSLTPADWGFFSFRFFCTEVGNSRSLDSWTVR